MVAVTGAALAAGLGSSFLALAAPKKAARAGDIGGE